MNKFTRSIRSKIVRIGNSQGIRIPRTLLQQLHLNSDVEMSVQDDQLIIRAARSPRSGWDDRFARAAPTSAVGEPAGEVYEASTEWDGTGWTW
jgi:antitoxin MazE